MSEKTDWGWRQENHHPDEEAWDSKLEEMPICADDRGCPQPGWCSKIDLVCPLRKDEVILEIPSNEAETEFHRDLHGRTFMERQDDWDEEARGWTGL